MQWNYADRSDHMDINDEARRQVLSSRYFACLHTADQFGTGLRIPLLAVERLYRSVLRTLTTILLLVLTQTSLGLAQHARTLSASGHFAQQPPAGSQTGQQRWTNVQPSQSSGDIFSQPHTYQTWQVEPSRVVSISPPTANLLPKSAVWTNSPNVDPVFTSNSFAFGINTGHCGIPAGCSSVCSPNACPSTECPPVSCVPCETCACDESGRSWAFDVSAIGLFRSDPSSVGLLRNPLDATESVNAGQFSFSSAAGIEAGLTFYTQAPALSFEVRGLFPNSWQSTVTESFTGTSVTVEGSPALVTTGPRISTSNYESDFQSLQLNVRWKPNFTSHTTLLLGARSLNLDEALTSTLVDPSNAFPDEIIQSVTDNRLFGIQLGITHNLLSTPNFCLKFDGNAGLFANDASQRSQLISLATPPVVFPANAAATDAAGLFELGIQGKWKLCSHANATFGYRVLALQGVSLASDQLRSVDFLNQRGLNNDSTLVLQTLTAGLEVHF